MEILIILLICALGFVLCGWGKTSNKRRQLERENGELEDLRQQKNQISLENEDLLIKQKNLYQKINELNEQQQILERTCSNEQGIIENQRREQEYLTRQLDTVRTTIELSIRNQKELAQEAFSSWCDALEREYEHKEAEYDKALEDLGHLYEDRHDIYMDTVRECEEEFKRRKAAIQSDLAQIQSELDKIKRTRAAAMEAQLREEEIKNQATFYTLQLNEADKRDVKYLQSIEFNLREARPLRMLIWSTFYRDKLNDLAARVGAVGASGIYKLTHIESGISYIGQAKDIKERWITHVKCSLGIDTPVTSQLYAFTREKGIDNFTFEILEKCSINELNEKEKFYIDLYQTYDFGLNATKGNK